MAWSKAVQVVDLTVAAMIVNGAAVVDPDMHIRVDAFDYDRFNEDDYLCGTCINVRAASSHGNETVFLKF